jgi:glutaconate CoA-transferase subunit B
MSENTMDFSTAELMAVAISRELRDDDFTAVGTASHIPLCGIRLAQRTHAPNLWFLYGGSGAVNSKARRLVEMAADFRNLEGAEYRTPLQDIIDFEFTGRFTCLFLGGMQIDQYGSMNMVAIGDPAGKHIRGPGTVGLAFTATIPRTLVYVQHHDPRLFVKKVDFVSGRGHDGGPEMARYRQPWCKGPTWVITPLATMDFETPDRRMRLRSVHPGHTLEEVQDKTGFELAVTGPVPLTEAPSAEQLRIIRDIDVDGVLRR